MTENQMPPRELFINGDVACAEGAISAGCRFFVCHSNLLCGLWHRRVARWGSTGRLAGSFLTNRQVAIGQLEDDRGDRRAVRRADRVAVPNADR